MKLSCNLFYPLSIAAALVASVAGAVAIHFIEPTIVNNDITALKIDAKTIVDATQANELFNNIVKSDGTSTVTTGLLTAGAHTLTYDDGSITTITVAAGVSDTVTVTNPIKANAPNLKDVSNWSPTYSDNKVQTKSTKLGDFAYVQVASNIDAVNVIKALNSNGIFTWSSDAPTVYVVTANAAAPAVIGANLHQCFRRNNRQLCINYTHADTTVRVSVRPYFLGLFEKAPGKFIIALVSVIFSVIASALVGSRSHYAIDKDGYTAGYISSSLPRFMKTWIMVTPDGLSDDQMNIAYYDDDSTDPDIYPGQGGSERRNPKNRAGAVTEAEDDIAEPGSEEVDARAISVAAIALLLPFLL